MGRPSHTQHEELRSYEDGLPHYRLAPAGVAALETYRRRWGIR